MSNGSTIDSSAIDSDSNWVAIAIVGKTRGNRGEVTAVALSSKLERYELLEEVTLFAPGGPAGGVKYEIEETWFHLGTLVFKFAGVDDISTAERLYGSEVRIPASQRVELEQGEYFQSDLIGCEVIDRRTGEAIGRVTGWDDGGGSGLLMVGELMIPFARKICVEIDPANKRIAVELPEGLKDLNRP